ncbi:MAG: hypothetical protein IPH06_13605 [Alphaproteobacteria bacterium]|nr:hypothetical protein [Alphaproteobacteria bacterium]MBK6897615.1 hypothetical protein [Alphaproteobacteria bacterium]
MEYALKATPCYVAGDENRADALWDRFANDIENAFCAIPKADHSFWEAATYLLDHPPRKQVLQDGALMFKDQVIDQSQKRAQQTLLMVRTVRNNLFHGGKHYPNGEQELGRNERLVSSALLVLKRSSSLCPEVRERYER